jgi:cytoskeleton-associated protein 5
MVHPQKVRTLHVQITLRSTDMISMKEAPPDPRMFAEEVDVVSKFPSGYEAALKSSKWKERKEALDEMLAVLQAALRIQDSPVLGDMSRALATMIQKDANIMCVIVAAQCLEALGKGLGEPFGRLREAIVPPMLERLKERKANVTDAIGLALDAVFSVVRSLINSIILFVYTVLDIIGRHHS